MPVVAGNEAQHVGVQPSQSRSDQHL
jgi:hypothetical protein